jgi:aminoglycoside phosphotransferase (APT) family kinase protein
VPIRVERDLDRTRRRLQDWLGVPLRAVTGAGPQGFSNETLVATPADPAARPLVVRVAPVRDAVQPAHRLAEQAAVLRALHAGSDVPVPAVLGHEPAADVLGGPFLVMEQVDGRAVPDLPSYHRGGWVHELSPPARTELWWQGVEVLGRVHRVDVAALGLGGLELPGVGATPLERLLANCADTLDFYGCADLAVVGTALEWLHEHRPRPTAAPSLLWGDARLGNLLFHGSAVSAVLDWEMVSVGPAEVDLGWFCWMDRFLSEGIGAPRLPGLPPPAETVQRAGAALGRPMADTAWYEVLAGLRFALVTARVVHLMDVTGLVPAGTRIPLHDNAVRLLATVLAERAAGDLDPVPSLR